MSPLFNFSSGNPNNLVAGASASMADIQGPLTDLRTAINGNLDETNVPNLTAAFTTYKRLEDASGQFSANVAGTYMLLVRPALGLGGATAPGANAFVGDHVMYLDSAIYAANSRTTKLFIRFFVAANATAPAVNYTVGLYPVATYGAVTTGNPFVATLGTVVTGSTVAVNAPTNAGNPNTVAGTDFNFPTAGAYVLAVQTSGTMATNSITNAVAQLEMRQV